MKQKGNFSKVIQATHRETKEVFALKVLETSHIHRLRVRHPNVFNEIQMEKKVLNELKHPNIIQLYHTFQDGANLYFLMEYLTGGEVWDLLMCDKSQIGCHEDLARFLAADVVNAIEYMHGCGVLHRYVIKQQNVRPTRGD